MALVTNRTPRISAIIIAYNEAGIIEKCLQSVTDWVDEIVVVDMMSTDGTREIVRRYTERLVDHPWLSYGDPVRNFAISQAKGDWIIMLDPDEQVPEALASRLVDIAEAGHLDAVRIPRRSIAFGHVMKTRTVADFPQLRFFRRGAIDWPSEVHGAPDLTRLRYLTLPEDPAIALIHDSWRSVPVVLDKIVRYAPKNVDQIRARGEHFSLSRLFRAPAGPFLRMMVYERAYEDGVPGLLAATYWAIYSFTIAAELWEAEGRTDRYDNTVKRWGRGLTTVYRMARGVKRALRR